MAKRWLTQETPDSKPELSLRWEDILREAIFQVIIQRFENRFIT